MHRDMNIGLGPFRAASYLTDTGAIGALVTALPGIAVRSAMPQTLATGAVRTGAALFTPESREDKEPRFG